MIRIDRGPIPAGFSNSAVNDAREQIRRFYKNPSESSRRRFEFPDVTQFPSIRNAVVRQFNGKCAYCESRTDSVYIDHFRPCSGALSLDGEVSPPHYWWLALTWQNLYLTCSVCNKRKGNRFPVREDRSAIEAAGRALLKERTLLLDPCKEDPAKHLVFSDEGFVASDTDEGRTTIAILDLNREALLQQRHKASRDVYHGMDLWLRGVLDLRALFGDLFADFHPFLAARYHALARWIAQHPEGEARLVATALGRTVLELAPNADIATLATQKVAEFREWQRVQEGFSVTDQAHDTYFLKSRLIHRIRIWNLKALHNIDLRLSESNSKGAPWLMLLGENGTGKSTILQAIALTLMGERHRRQVGRLASFVRQGARDGGIEIWLTGREEPLSLTITAKGRVRVADTKLKVLLLGYGATRLLPRGRRRAPRSTAYVRAMNLFDPFAPLVDAKQFLVGIHPAAWESASRALRELLFLGENDELLRDGSDVFIVKADGKIPLNGLSDGEQALVSLSVDIFSVMHNLWDRMDDAEGVVLIDELGPHLHPRWKMQVVTRLRRAFPRLQFITSTHDPLCLRGLFGGEIVRMERTEIGHVVAHTNLPSPVGMRVDQLLTSEHFGLWSTIDPETEMDFRRYYSLRALESRSMEQEAELRQLRAKFSRADLLGKNPRERLMLEVADEYIARRQRADPEKREALSEQARHKMLEIFKRYSPSGEKVPENAVEGDT